GGCPSLSCPSGPRKVLPSIATWGSVSSCRCACNRLGSLPPCSTLRAFSSTSAITVTICCASQRAKASLYVELVGKRFGQFNWPRSHTCLSLIQSTMPFTLVSPANFPSISKVNNNGNG